MKKIKKRKLYKKVYAPTVAYVRTKDNIIIRVPFTDEKIKKGEQLTISKNGEKYNGVAEEILCECKDEFPCYDFLKRKHYKRIKND